MRHNAKILAAGGFQGEAGSWPPTCRDGKGGITDIQEDQENE
jgi:hypothetical protein